MEGSTCIPISIPEFRLFRELILAETGISLADSKQALVSSRIGRRLNRLSLTNFQEYYDLLRYHDPEKKELECMINCVTTNKTSFFREGEHFTILEHQVKSLVTLATKSSDRRMRIWSAACSTGQEPYTLAMTVAGVLESFGGWDVKILASDLDTEVLTRAERGVYPASELDDVPAPLHRKYFLRGKGEWQDTVRVKADLRRWIRFRRINFVDPEWPVRTRFDAIFCRNVMIYFDRPSQERLVRRLAGYLTPGGLLYVGHSENLHWSRDVLEPAGQTVYRLKAT